MSQDQEDFSDEEKVEKDPYEEYKNQEIKNLESYRPFSVPIWCNGKHNSLRNC